jgi:RNA polymerase sigma-70 factor, ECF subfamily
VTLTAADAPEVVEVDRLALLARAGDREAFDRLYACCVGRVYAVCFRMSGNVADAERLTQDVFVRVWVKLASFRGESSFTSWMHRLTVNLVLEDARSTTRREARVAVVSEPEEFDPGISGDPGNRMDLDAAIARLPDGARTALVLHDVEGFKHEEIARMSGIAVGTVKAQLHRARKLMREMLER